jgi:hypothetical protein
MFIVTLTKVENVGSKKWIDFSDINSGKYSRTRLPENYILEEFLKVEQYADNIRSANTISDVFILREIVNGLDGNFISIRAAYPENLANWRLQFSSLASQRDEILQMINATMTYKDVNCESHETMISFLDYSYDELNSMYFQS